MKTTWCLDERMELPQTDIPMFFLNMRTIFFHCIKAPFMHKCVSYIEFIYRVVDVWFWEKFVVHARNIAVQVRVENCSRSRNVLWEVNFYM